MPDMSHLLFPSLHNLIKASIKLNTTNINIIENFHFENQTLILLHEQPVGDFIEATDW
jgi:hypothetical protein